MNEDRSKLLERVRKLLAMANDTGSPHEAAIAARRAKKLMDEYNIEHAETLAAEMTAADFGEVIFGEGYRAFPGWLNQLALAVSQFCDVRVKFVRAPEGRKKIMFRGEKSDLEVCCYLYTYLERAARRLAEQSEFYARSERTAFRIAVVQEVAARLKAMKAEEYGELATGKGLVLVDKKLALLDELFGQTRTRRQRARLEADAYAAGRAAGARVGINRALNGARGTKLLGR